MTSGAGWRQSPTLVRHFSNQRGGPLLRRAHMQCEGGVPLRDTQFRVFLQITPSFMISRIVGMSRGRGSASYHISLPPMTVMFSRGFPSTIRRRHKRLPRSNQEDLRGKGWLFPSMQEVRLPKRLPQQALHDCRRVQRGTTFRDPFVSGTIQQGQNDVRLERHFWLDFLDVLKKSGPIAV
ncbi:hypothetical protein C8N36_1312 [Pelagimonas varians]|uniref:Uncharacterized protein n=1 Tax=Pelagimonas varians TaxID=696760 RepID=A0A238L560_9RHOB|nr:hypothetical protein C8N36_1312 [Pelagimonas varians]SMX50243.1 hypothetical protein PEV8663_04560 [Pelagimonas varians]